MSLTALAIDAILPALGEIQTGLGINGENDVQYVISIVFLGMAFGLMLYGPLSDAYGRKPPLYLGIGIFIIGCLVSLYSFDLNTMLFGRFLQGFGTAACRVVSGAMIRDQFVGVEMGRIMSLIMMVFIIVPALAPLLGQIILIYGEWHDIFSILIIMSLLGLLMLIFRQEETLEISKRNNFSFTTIGNGIKETILNPLSRGYTIAAGLVFSAFVGYLSSSQQILSVQYKLGDKFPFYFGSLALCIGFSAFINSRLVKKHGMQKLSSLSLIALTVLSLIYFSILWAYDGSTPLSFFMGYLGLSFLFIGFLFGNLNTMAIEPLGHIAGVANSVISSVQTLISVFIGGFVGQMYDGTVYPLVIGFGVLSLMAFVVIKFSEKCTSNK